MPDRLYNLTGPTQYSGAGLVVHPSSSLGFQPTPQAKRSISDFTYPTGAPEFVPNSDRILEDAPEFNCENFEIPQCGLALVTNLAPVPTDVPRLSRHLSDHCGVGEQQDQAVVRNFVQRARNHRFDNLAPPFRLPSGITTGSHDALKVLGVHRGLSGQSSQKGAVNVKASAQFGLTVAVRKVDGHSNRKHRQDCLSPRCLGLLLKAAKADPVALHRTTSMAEDAELPANLSRPQYPTYGWTAPPSFKIQIRPLLQGGSLYGQARVDAGLLRSFSNDPHFINVMTQHSQEGARPILCQFVWPFRNEGQEGQ
ncbi:hypothetical protein [Pseudoxanthomonas sp.]|uniref:hypothetical protein n=1 Tax=Pseudoxanthomonas sp. TaxID=1871049 RepID=UPI003F7E6CB6